MRKTYLFLAFVFLGFSVDAQKTWTLEQCVIRAIDKNLSIKNIDLNIKGAEVDMKQAKMARLPNLSGNIGTNVNFGRSIDPTSNSFIAQTFFSNNFGISSGVMLYNGGRIRNTIEQSILSYKSNQLSKEQVERDIALNVASQYLNVLFTRENQTIAENNYLATESQVEQMVKLVNSGARAESERYNLEAQLATNDQSRIAAKNAFEIAILQLKQTLLLDMDEPFTVADVAENIDIDTDPDIITINELYSSAIGNQRSVQAAEVGVQAADVGIDIAKSQLLPTITLGGSLNTNYSNRGMRVDGFEESTRFIDATVNGVDVVVGLPQTDIITSNNPYGNQLNDNLGYGFGLNVGIPIYSNYSPRASIERAKIGKERSMIQLDQEKQTLLTSVQQALADAKAAKSSLLAAEKSRDAQKLAYDNAQKRYEIDAIGAFELTNTKAQYDNAVINYLLSKYDYIFRTKVLDFYLGKPIKLN